MTEPIEGIIYTRLLVYMNDQEHMVCSFSNRVKAIRVSLDEVEFMFLDRPLNTDPYSCSGWEYVTSIENFPVGIGRHLRPASEIDIEYITYTPEI